MAYIYAGLQQFETLGGDWYKVYLLEMSLEGKRYLKVGITKFKDVRDRILYNARYDQEVPWVELFDNVRIIKSITVYGKVSALRIENEILNVWDPLQERITKVNGVTEMTDYSSEAFDKAVEIIEENRIRF